MAEEKLTNTSRRLFRVVQPTRIESRPGRLCARARLHGRETLWLGLVGKHHILAGC